MITKTETAFIPNAFDYEDLLKLMSLDYDLKGRFFYNPTDLVGILYSKGVYKTEDVREIIGVLRGLNHHPYFSCTMSNSHGTYRFEAVSDGLRKDLVFQSLEELPASTKIMFEHG